MENLGQKIYNLRKAKSVSQERLAEQLNVSRQTIYKWESGYVQPSGENLRIICEIFGVDAQYFYSDSEVAVYEEKPLTAEDIVCANDIVEVKEQEASPRSSNKYTALTVVFGILTVCFAFLSVMTWFIADPMFKGDLIEKSVPIDIYTFLIVLVVNLIIAAIFVFSLVKMIKNKKCKQNVNKM